MTRIAVWNTAFLGDAVLTLPLLDNLRRHFPAAHIDFYVRPGLRSLFAAHPGLNNVIVFDKREGAAGMPAFVRRIARQEYSLWISAHTSIRSGIMARASGAKTRIGYLGGASALWYTSRVDRRFGELDEIERLLLLLRPLSITPAIVWPEIVLPEEDTVAAAAFFSSLMHGCAIPALPVLGIHPGSVWRTKQWPVAYFADIGARALTRGANVLVFAGPGEEKMAALVEEGIRAQVGSDLCDARLRNLAGALSLPRLAAYLGRLSCYLTNDSGPMHLAWAQRTPVTAIFGPTTRRLGFFPRGKTATVLETALPCRPCGLHGARTCPLGHHRCMKDVTPDMVWPDVERKLFG